MKDAVRNLRADKSIHILKADKRNATVVLDRVEYNNKVLALLNSKPTKSLKVTLQLKLNVKYVRNYLILKSQICCLKKFMII